MPFEKGRAKTGGKQKGAKNRKTQAWDELGDFITNEGAKNAMEIINSYAVKNESGEFTDPEKFLQHYNNLLEYFQPKRQRVENEQDGEVVIRVVHE